MNPALAAKAASLTVVPCDSPDVRYHVVGGSEAHIVKPSRFEGRDFYCDCHASRFGARCSHALAVEFFAARSGAAGPKKGA